MSNKDSLTIPAATSGVIDSNAASVVTNLPGGAIKMQFGKPEDWGRTSVGAMEGGVQDGGGYRADGAGNVEKFGQVTRHQTEAAKFSGDPLATAMTPWGSPASSITRESVLTFADGVPPIPVKTAINMGWLREDGPGRYVVTGRHTAEIAALRGQR
jgi:hypothetical protein